jgi:acyl CoA:acetate/3-ketoacid CoA transferase
MNVSYLSTADNDVIRKMSFKPMIKGTVKEMDEKIFNESTMGIRNEIKLT